LLEHLLTNVWSIEDSVINNIEQFGSILASNTDKNNIKELLIRIYRAGKDTLINPMINILKSYKLLGLIKKSEVSDLFIDLINDQYHIKIDSLNKLIYELKLLGFDINAGNKNGYNFYSYIIGLHTCSMARTRFEKSLANETLIDTFERTLVDRESQYKIIIQTLEALGFTNNNRVIRNIPNDFTGVPWDFTVDNVKCKNYVG
jgi:hypothetical protein